MVFIARKTQSVFIMEEVESSNHRHRSNNKPIESAERDKSNLPRRVDDSRLQLALNLCFLFDVKVCQLQKNITFLTHADNYMRTPVRAL